MPVWVNTCTVIAVGSGLVILAYRRAAIYVAILELLLVFKSFLAR
jgi:hypothetical protein